MGFFDQIFGHGASDPGFMTQGVRSAIDDYQSYLKMMYSPEAVRGRVSNFSGNYDTSMRNSQQAGNAQYGMRGIRATPQMALRRSNDTSNFADRAQMEAYQGMVNGARGAMDMYSQARPFFHRDASGGLVGKLGGLAEQAGQYAAMSQGVPAGVKQDPTGQPWGEAIPSWQTQPGMPPYDIWGNGGGNGTVPQSPGLPYPGRKQGGLNYSW